MTNPEHLAPPPPPPGAPPAPESAATPPRRPSSAVPAWWRSLAIGLAAAVVGLVIAMLVRGGSDTASAGDDPAGDAATACAVFAKAPDTIDMQTQQAEIYRLSAAEAMAQLAAQRDGTYVELARALGRPRQIAMSTFRADGPEFVKAMGDARRACDAL